MQEKSDTRIRDASSNQAGQQEQMVVVNPDRIAALHSAHDFVRKAFVDRAICVPFGSGVSRVRRERVEQRPQRPVREARIVGSRDFPREEHRATVEFLLEACGDLPRLRRQDLTWPAEPTRLVLAVERRQARGDPARIRLNVEPIPNPPQADRQAVRDEKEGHRYRESVIRSGP